MKHCVKCGKILRKGSEIHRIDEELYCSKDCAVSHLSELIIMSAKDAAIEMYDEAVEVFTEYTMDEEDDDTCYMCGKKLASCDTIYAAEGALYCSRECGIQHFESAYGSVAERHFDNVMEEVTPAEIGIEPTSKGLTRKEIYEAIESLAKSQGFYARLLNRINGAEDEDRDVFFIKLEEQNFKDTVDLVLYLEG